MKTLIYFNRPDCPSNMGISQLTDDVQAFLDERSDILINATILNGKIEFENTEGVKGYAITTKVPETFEN
jgi:hypothetical protein